MTGKIIASGILLCLLCISLAGAAGPTTDALSPLDAAASVYISDYTVKPQVFFPYESGTVTVFVTNPTNQSIGVSQPNLIYPHIHVNNADVFATMTTLGPGTTTAFVFVVTVDGSEGTYFPTFTVSPDVFGGAPIHGQLKILVDATDIHAGIANRPDSFALSRKDTVNVSIDNPREGNITDVLIVPAGAGFNVSPAESYIGVLPAESSLQVPFFVTPITNSPDLRFHITYRNGDNPHATDLLIPLTTGEDKTAASPVINNLAIEPAGSGYHITGDVNNAGISDAQAMVLTTGAPAHPVEPYTEYAVGTLASGDFSGFDLTFTADDLSAVPILIRWKDTSGNPFGTERVLDLRSIAGTVSAGSSGSRAGIFGSAGANSSGGPGGQGGGNRGPPGGGGFFFGGGRGGGLAAFYPVIAGFIILVAAVVLYSKRKWIRQKLKRS